MNLNINMSIERLILKNTLDNASVLVAEIQGDHILIHNSVLKRNMEEIGISIPESQQVSFEGKQVVYLDEKNQALFIKAFKEIYYIGMPKNIYSWTAQA